MSTYRIARAPMGAVMAAILIAGSSGLAGVEPVNEMADLDLDQLMRVNVTSVAGVNQEWFRAPAATYVLTQEDIRNAGHLTIADSLRLVPGVHVARLNANVWSISTRGFNGRLANKQLVQIDGRPVTDHFFAGVSWDAQQPVLGDLDRIEIVRGPGTTLWGGNAVNGVINITTRSAEQTQGVYLSGALGTGDTQGLLEARYGGKLGENAFYRVYGRFIDVAGTDQLESADAGNDNWNMLNGGVRFDFGTLSDTRLTVELEAVGSDRIGSMTNPGRFVGAVTPSQPFETELHGGHVRAALAHETEDEGWQLQFVFDTRERSISALSTELDAFDLDWRHHFRASDRDEIVWGLRIQHFAYDSVTAPFAPYGFIPAGGEDTTFSGFIQNTYAIAPDELFFAIGSKFEHNEFTGFEFQPSARLWWTPNDRNTVWTSVTRSVRVPTLTDTSAAVMAPPPYGPLLISAKDADSELAWSYEVGYRTRLASSTTLDVALYYTDYPNLFSMEPGPLGTGAANNDASGYTIGGEATLNWRATDKLNLITSYSYGRMGSEERVYYTASTMPEHLLHVGAEYALTRRAKAMAHAYYTDSWIDDGVRDEIPSYVRLDLGLRYAINDSVELSVWGQNLLDDRHYESTRALYDMYEGVTQMGRSAYVQMTVKF